MKSEVPATVLRARHRYRVIPSPAPHVLVHSNKQLHGWWPGLRTCTPERMLLNPYNGCSVGCPFCYARGFPGFFQLFRRTGVVAVAENYPQLVAQQLDSLDFAACGYLSPVCDPFQPVDGRYQLSRRILEVFVARNLPVSVTTKRIIPPVCLDILARQRHASIQVSMLTPREPLRRILVPRGATVRQLLQNVEQAGARNVAAVCRVDPVLPYITDAEHDMHRLVRYAAEAGAAHVVTSVVDIPLAVSREFFRWIGSVWGTAMEARYHDLYRDRIGRYLHAEQAYRRRVFRMVRDICDSYGLTFALCMEHERRGHSWVDLNSELMTSVNCDGSGVPVYRRRGRHFVPAAGCNGACLRCDDARCGLPELAMGRSGSRKDWRLPDWRRWSRRGQEEASWEGRRSRHETTSST